MQKKLYSDDRIQITESDALIVVDMQNDFLPGGSLAVPDGDKIIPGINTLANLFFQRNQVIFTQDWHPLDHQSFASSHPGKNPFDHISGLGLGPLLWPDHCVQGSKGADFARNINQTLAKMILRKGYHRDIDSYSAFMENDKTTKTGLFAYLKSFNVTRVFVCGLALDYCVKYTSLDSKNLGFETYIVQDLSKPVITDESAVFNLLNELKSSHVHLINSHQFQET
jgi:nicotinamidase/pyrazinamidase